MRNKLLNIGIVMDPIDTIDVETDTSFRLLLEAQARRATIYYFEQKDLFIKDGVPYGHAKLLKLKDQPKNWFQFTGEKTIALKKLNCIFMRKDPPVTMSYIYTTHILELAQREGVTIINDPQALRDANEKLFISWFPQCCAPTIVSAHHETIVQFLTKYKDIIVKPLDGMGGRNIFRVRKNDVNLNSIIETLTQNGEKLIMAQRYIPDIKYGDKRILMLHGKPLPYALARLAKKGETRANIAAGGTGVGVKLSARDRWICEQVGPTLLAKGLLFVGIDVIGNYLTEINVTSPTCLRELEAIYKTNFCADFFDQL